MATCRGCGAPLKALICEYCGNDYSWELIVSKRLSSVVSSDPFYLDLPIEQVIYSTDANKPPVRYIGRNPYAPKVS